MVRGPRRAPTAFEVGTRLIKYLAFYGSGNELQRMRLRA